MDFQCYTKTYDYELIQSVELDNIRLTITRIKEFDMCYTKVFYDVTMVYGAMRVFRSVEADIDRTWFIYDTLKDGLPYYLIGYSLDTIYGGIVT